MTSKKVRVISTKESYKVQKKVLGFFWSTVLTYKHDQDLAKQFQNFLKVVPYAKQGHT